MTKPTVSRPERITDFTLKQMRENQQDLRFGMVVYPFTDEHREWINGSGNSEKIRVSELNEISYWLSVDLDPLFEAYLRFGVAE